MKNNNNIHNVTTSSSSNRKVSLEEYQARQLLGDEHIPGENTRPMFSHTAGMLRAINQADAAGPARKVSRTSSAESHVTTVSINTMHEESVVIRYIAITQRVFQNLMRAIANKRNKEFRDGMTEQAETKFNLALILADNFYTKCLPSPCELNTEQLIISGWAPSLDLRDIIMNGVLKIVGPIFFINNIKPGSVIDLSETVIKSKNIKAALMSASSTAILRDNKAHISWKNATIIISRALYDDFCQERAARDGNYVMTQFIPRI